MHHLYQMRRRRYSVSANSSRTNDFINLDSRVLLK